MAAGLMTLAYMIEMAAVFNLAYLELNKGRYLEKPREAIEALKIRIKSEPVGPVSPEVWVKRKTEILDRLDEITSQDRTKRQVSWVTRSGAEETLKLKHYDKLACEVYEFFDKEKDKSLAQHFLILISVLLPAITIADHYHLEQLQDAMYAAAIMSAIGLILWVVHVVTSIGSKALARSTVGLCVAVCGVAIASPDLYIHSRVMSSWWYFFVLLFVGLILPGIFILFGRRLRGVLHKIQLDYEKQFDELMAVPVGPALQKMA